MSKKYRAREEEVYVFGFVPSYLMPNKSPNALDPFLEPFVRDVEDSFIEGIDVIMQFF